MNRPPAGIAPDDETYWSQVRAQYEVDETFLNLENGHFGMAALPVLKAQQAYQSMVNRQSTRFMREQFPQRLADAVAGLARFCDVGGDELIITRNATEGMNILIQGYPFAPDDEIVICNQDYDHVVAIVDMLESRNHLKAMRIDFDFGASDDEIVSRYRDAITARTRAILVTHMWHRNGQITPVAEIARMARARGVDVFVDAAHSFAQVDFVLPDLDADFVAANLHKWLGAPLGAGVLHIKRERITDIAPLFGDAVYPHDDIRKLAHFGTMPPAAVMAIEDAIAFHCTIGGANKEARLRFLKQRWTSRTATLPGIDMLTPAEAHRSCAIAAIRVADKHWKEVVDYLFEKHGIYTTGAELGTDSFVRITPYLYHSAADIDRLIDALTELQA